MAASRRNDDARLSEKAKKAEFTGAHKQALEQHDKALHLLKHDGVDDGLETKHIRVRERNIVEFGGPSTIRRPLPPHHLGQRAWWTCVIIGLMRVAVPLIIAMLVSS